MGDRRSTDGALKCAATRANQNQLLAGPKKLGRLLHEQRQRRPPEKKKQAAATKSAAKAKSTATAEATAKAPIPWSGMAATKAKPRPAFGFLQTFLPLQSLYSAASNTPSFSVEPPSGPPVPRFSRALICGMAARVESSPAAISCGVFTNSSHKM